MKNITKILILFVFCLSSAISAQNERPIEVLLEVLSQNHMGSVTDVFTLEEIQVIKDHYAETTFPSNNHSVLENRRYASTQSVTQVDAVDINPVDISSVETLINSPISAFPGAGVHLRGQGSGIPGPPRIIIIDNDGHLWQRDPGENPISINDLGELTGIPSGHSITGMEVVSGPGAAAIYGISTNGTNQTLLVTISPDDMTVTVIGNNNGLVLPIALGRDANQNLITADIDDDNLYQLDKITGAATLIGSLGYDANFGQAIFFDEFSQELVNLAYDATIGDSMMRYLDPLTGASTYMGQIQPGTVQQFGWGSTYDRDVTAGVDENGIDGFRMYPNPAQAQITLTASNSIEAIEIYSVLGQVVLKEYIKANNYKVDISLLAAGAYILKVSASNKTGVYKLIKQ